MLNSSIILLFIISFLDLALGLFVFLKNSRGRENISFTLMSLFGLIWINASFFQDEITNTSFRYFLLKLDFASGIFAAFLLLLFCLDIGKARFASSRRARMILIGIPFLFTLLIFLSRHIISGHAVNYGTITPLFGVGKSIYDLAVGLALFFGIGVLLRKYRTAVPEDKGKFTYLFLGFFLTAVIAFMTNIGLANYIQTSVNYQLYSRLGAFGGIFIILFSGYAIIKHRLLNIKIITTELLSLGILVFSLFQVLEAQSLSSLISNGIVFTILLAFVIMLVRSVEEEVRRKDELQILSTNLASANEKLKELDLARAEFMSFASHQLRTPLTAIRGFASLLLEGSGGVLTEAEKDMIGKISVSSERMSQLVEDYLNLTRIESGKLEYKFNSCHMEDICQEVVDTLALKAKENNLSLIYRKPAETLPEVMIDGLKVREVVSNLVDNAIKYTPAGSVTVSMKWRKDDHCIRVTVADTGMGISAADIPKLFAKFARVKDEQHLKVKGTGLGLYVGKVMIKNNGGRIWAESEGIDQGTRFIVELPIKLNPDANRGGSDRG